jgi:hypothetical protein
MVSFFFHWLTTMTAALMRVADALVGGLSNIKVRGSYPYFALAVFAVIGRRPERRPVLTASRYPSDGQATGGHGSHLRSPATDNSMLSETPIAVATVIKTLLRYVVGFADTYHIGIAPVTPADILQSQLSGRIVELVVIQYSKTIGFSVAWIQSSGCQSGIVGIIEGGELCAG